MKRPDVQKTIKRAPGGSSSRCPTVQHGSTMEIAPDLVFNSTVSENRAYLECLDQDALIDRIALKKDTVTIGRDQSANVVIPSTNVSRNHARIGHQGEQYFIEDLDSTNGTIVNGVKISRCILHNNDQIQIGRARFNFVQQRRRQTQ